MLAGDHTVERCSQCHHPVHDPLCFVQHIVVVGVDRDIGMHITVAGVHVGGDEQTTGTHAGVKIVEPGAYRFEFPATEYILQRARDLRAPGNAQITAQQEIDQPVARAPRSPRRVIEQRIAVAGRRSRNLPAPPASVRQPAAGAAAQRRS